MSQRPMISAYLTPTEKDMLAHRLSTRARAGGWFFMGLAGFMLLLILFTGLRPGASPTLFTTAEDIAAIFTPILVLVGAGGWLLRQQRVIRRWLDEPLQQSRGRIMGQRQVPYLGYRLQLQIRAPSGEMLLANMSYLGQPDWQIGDELELLLWANGRFCPRHITHLVDIAYLPTHERRRLVKRRIIKIIVWYLILVVIAILFALYGQGRL